MYYDGGVILGFKGLLFVNLYILFCSNMGVDIMSFIWCCFCEYECVVNGEFVSVNLIVFCIGDGIEICMFKGVL